MASKTPPRTEQSTSTSFESIGSIGIGKTTTTAQSPSSPNTKLIQDIPRLRPEDGGALPDYICLYDCIVYYMMCPNHDRIAITRLKRARNSSNRDRRIIWLPFIVLPDHVTWEQAANDGLTLLFGYKDDEDSAHSKLPPPPMQVSPMQFLRIQLSGDRYFIRYAYFVHIEKRDNYVCCQDIEQSDRSSVITWMSMNDIVQNENLWGPEMLNFTEKLAEQMNVIDTNAASGSSTPTMTDTLIDLQIHEQTLDNIVGDIMTDKIYGKFLNGCKITSDMIIAAYEEYLEHCWPATLMCMVAFKTFLVRYGYPRNDTSAQEWIFNALDIERLGYLNFHQVLVGIVCLDPATPNDNSIRLKMVFRYYALEKNQELLFEEFVSLVHDLHPSMEAKKLRQTVEELERKIRDPNAAAAAATGGGSQTITFQAFEQAIRNRILKGTEKLVRSSKSIIGQMMHLNKVKNDSRTAVMVVRHHHPKSPKTPSSPTSKRTRGAAAAAPGTCNGCRAQKYKFGTHCVCLDTSGRCVKPLRLFDVEIRDTITPSRYSAEYVFGMNTICRNFLDLVRRAYQQNESLFSTTEDLPLALQTIRTLCEFVRLILECEDRFMKINAPAIVIGDIGGRIDSIMSLEKAFWTQVPIMTTNLIFLGNYVSGNNGSDGGSTKSSKSNVDVICYLFALKIAAPNQVCLLRGYNETCDTSKELLKECIQKYGPEDGRQLWMEFNRSFNLLPYAILVDESILCVHSGLPRVMMPITKFSEIPKKIANPAKESQLALEITFLSTVNFEYSNRCSTTNWWWWWWRNKSR
nr:uncharacterized protein LOC124497236 isoform X2 [Dermatophagoides farinae]